MPVLTIFGGPNGSGKSSVIQRLEFGGRERLLEADAIASRIFAADPGRAAIRAGREVLTRTQEYLDSGQDFAIETTLSGSWTTRVIKQAQAHHFSALDLCLLGQSRATNPARSGACRPGRT